MIPNTSMILSNQWWWHQFL